MKFIFSFSAVLISSFLSKAQCPGYGKITANDKCIFVTWDTIPAVVADSLLYLPATPPKVYYLVSSSAPGTRPFVATYRDGTPGSGACSAASSLVVDGAIVFYNTVASTVVPDTCDYVGGVLPLILLRFDGQIQASNNIINWSVAKVDNVSGFVVEMWDEKKPKPRTVSETPYEEGKWEYNFTHRDVQSTDCFYRLKIRTNDGSFSYSPSIRLQNNNVLNQDASLKIYPNPATNLVTLKIMAKDWEGQVVYVRNQMGVIIKEIKIQKETKIDLSLEGMMQGTYIFQCPDGHILKLEKQ